MIKKSTVQEKINKAVAYLRTSSDKQAYEDNKVNILKFAGERNLGEIDFVEEQYTGKLPWKKRIIKSVIDDMSSGDKLIVPALSGLGKSMLEIMEILAAAKDKDIAIYDVKNGWELNGGMQSKILAMIFSMAAEIERDLISKRTADALKTARARGRVLGRPRGTGKSKLDQYREEIVELLKNGSTQIHIARKYKTTQPNLYHWLKKNKLADIKPVY